ANFFCLSVKPSIYPPPFFIYFKHTTHTPTIRYTSFVVSNVFQAIKIAVPWTPPHNTTALNSIGHSGGLNVEKHIAVHLYILILLIITYILWTSSNRRVSFFIAIL